MADPKRITFKRLRDKLNTLTEEQLAHEVRCIGEEMGGYVSEISIAESDMVSDEGMWMSRTEYIEDLIKAFDMSREEAEEEADGIVVAVKGEPILFFE